MLARLGTRSQTWLATASGVPLSTFNAFLKAKRKYLRGEVVDALVEALGGAEEVGGILPNRDQRLQTLIEIWERLTDIEREEVRNYAAFMLVRRTERGREKGGVVPARKLRPRRVS